MFQPKSKKVWVLYNIGFAHKDQSPSSRPRLQVHCQKFEESADICSKKSYLSKRGRKVVEPEPEPYALPRSQTTALRQAIDTLWKDYSNQLLSELNIDQAEIVSIILSEAIRHQGEVSI